MPDPHPLTAARLTELLRLQLLLDQPDLTLFDLRLYLADRLSICTRNCTTNLRQRCTTFAERRAIEKLATLQQRCTTIECTIHGCNQHGETPPGVMVC